MLLPGQRRPWIQPFLQAKMEGSLTDPGEIDGGSKRSRQSNLIQSPSLTLTFALSHSHPKPPPPKKEPLRTWRRGAVTWRPRQLDLNLCRSPGSSSLNLRRKTGKRAFCYSQYVGEERGGGIKEGSSSSRGLDHHHHCNRSCNGCVRVHRPIR